MTTALASATLRIQCVLYGNPLPAVRRLTESLAQTVSIARSAGLLSDVTLAFGDCSPAPLLDEAALAGLTELAEGLVLEVRHFGANLGHGGGHNALSEGSAFDQLLIINPDTIAEPLLLPQLLAQRDPSVAIVEARQLPVEHPKEHHPDYWVTPWTSMACALLRGDAVREVGLFDTASFFMHGDDVDLSWRMRLAGYQLVHAPMARVFHDKRIGTQGYIESSQTELVYGSLGNLMLAYKYSRDDQVAFLTDVFGKGSAEQREALDVYRAKVSAGTLPDRLDPEGSVAAFVNGNFAHHRF